MTIDDLQTLLNSTAVLGAFLLVGLLLRAKVPLFRKLLIPASVLGGIFGLLIGPQVLGHAGVKLFSDEWINLWSLEPSILMIPIFASLPLCNFSSSKGKRKLDKRHACTVFMEGGIGGGAFAMQMLLGVSLALLIGYFVPALYPYNNFGCEMVFGFNGGHSLAGLLGGLLMDSGRDYWEVAQSVGCTYSTIGLLGGIITGIMLINRAIKKGQTAMVKGAVMLDADSTSGCVKDIESQNSLGRETTHNSAINTVTVHLALVLGVSYLGYLLNVVFTNLGWEFFAALPAYIWAMMIAYPINFIMNKMKLAWLFDDKVKGAVVAVCTDFAIVSAMASMNLSAVILYLLPICIISAIAFVATYFATFGLMKLMLPNNYSFERAIIFYGMNTGVVATGITLLRIIDPDFKSPALEDFSLANIFMNLKDVIFVPVYLSLIVIGTPWQLLGWALLEMVVMYMVALVAKLIDRHEARMQNASVEVAK